MGWTQYVVSSLTVLRAGYLELNTLRQINLSATRLRAIAQARGFVPAL